MSQFCRGLDNSLEREFYPTHITTGSLYFWNIPTPGQPGCWIKRPSGTLVSLEESQEDLWDITDINGCLHILYIDAIPIWLEEI